MRCRKICRHSRLCKKMEVACPSATLVHHKGALHHITKFEYYPLFLPLECQIPVNKMQLKSAEDN
jgi:hypothetical protein